MLRLFFPLRAVLSLTISSTDQVALQLWEIFNRLLPVPYLRDKYLLSLFVNPVVSLGCVLLTVFRNRNIENRSYKSFVFTEIHIKIVKHLLNVILNISL